MNRETLIGDSLAQLSRKGGEGTIPYMYLDTEGRVTAGIGVMIADRHAAAMLADEFVLVGPGTATKQAARQAVCEVFDKVRKQRYGKHVKAERFERFNEYKEQVLRLSNPAVTARKIIEKTVLRLERLFGKQFATFPDDAQRALVDMMYNLGPDGFAAYKCLIVAATKGDWNAAAEQCYRGAKQHPEALDRRNLETYARFEKAAQIGKPLGVRAGEPPQVWLRKWRSKWLAGHPGPPTLPPPKQEPLFGPARVLP